MCTMADAIVGADSASGTISATRAAKSPFRRTRQPELTANGLLLTIRCRLEGRAVDGQVHWSSAPITKKMLPSKEMSLTADVGITFF